MKAAFYTLGCKVNQYESEYMAELLKNAGLDSPFEERCLRGVCETAKAWLDAYDLTGIQ